MFNLCKLCSAGTLPDSFTGLTNGPLLEVREILGLLDHLFLPFTCSTITSRSPVPKTSSHSHHFNSERGQIDRERLICNESLELGTKVIQMTRVGQLNLVQVLRVWSAACARNTWTTHVGRGVPGLRPKNVLVSEEDHVMLSDPIATSPCNQWPSRVPN